MTTKENKADATYAMGHPAGEEQRLQRLGQLQFASTKHLLAQAGIVPGMKVLDVGSGAGDVALLLAELIGPKGSIVGVDVYPTVLETARARLQAAGFEHATFLAGDIREVELDNDFDAVVGRNRSWILSRSSTICHRERIADFVCRRISAAISDSRTDPVLTDLQHPGLRVCIDYLLHFVTIALFIPRFS